MIKVIELFAGVGCQREALKRADIEHEIVAISENDKYASRAYELLHGPTNNLGDIKNIERLPKADLWTYSFPCTDISISGRMKGFDKGSNTHSSLLWEVQRLLEVNKANNELPKYLLMENVKNIVSKKFMPLFQVWLDYLESLGYKNFYKVLNAKDYGIPQNRERCFVISIRDKDAHYDDIIKFDVNKITPMVTWGITPEMAIGIDEKIPEPTTDIMKEALEYMKFKAGTPIKGTKIDVAFIGSCTNGRIEDFRIAAEILKGKKVAKSVKALAVPGSVIVKEQAEKEGLDVIFKEAGFEWREPGCSMCLAMNPDKLVGDQISASTSNRNFKGRQGSATGRTMLLSPAMVAAAAVEGAVTDVRDMI